MKIESEKKFFFSVTTDILVSSEISSRITSLNSGALLVFSGDVRNHDGGRNVLALEYESHPTAAATLEEIGREALLQPQIHGVAIVHRIGNIPIGESALIVAVVAEHRAEAFQLCAHIVDQVKLRTPIWKHQFFADGSDEWVNSP